MLARKKMSQKKSNSVKDAESRFRSDIADGYEIINQIDEKAENLISDMDNSPPTRFSAITHSKQDVVLRKEQARKIRKQEKRSLIPITSPDSPYLKPLPPGMDSA